MNGEIVRVPTHKLTDNIVQNGTHNGHMNLYIPVEKLNIDKLKSILTGMAGVLAQSSHVLQDKHRRVHFDAAPGSTQTIGVLIDCYLNTNDYDSFLTMKDDVFLELINVINTYEVDQEIQEI